VTSSRFWENGGFDRIHNFASVGSESPWDPIAEIQKAKAEEIMNRYPKTPQKLANSE